MTFPTDPSRDHLRISVGSCSLSLLVFSLPFLLLFHRRGGSVVLLSTSGGGSSSSSSKEPSSGPTEDFPKQGKIGENGTWVNGRFVHNYKGTNRLPDMDSFQWNALDKMHKNIVKYSFLKYGKSFPTDIDVANAVPCRPLVENQEIDHDLLSDSVDAIQDNELVRIC